MANRIGTSTSVEFTVVGEILVARVAGVFDPKSDEEKEANDFYELVARNRGFKVRHFYTEHEAFAWLQR